MKRVSIGVRRSLVAGQITGVALIAACLLASAAEASSARTQLTVYALATQAQFVNYQDGIVRAQGHNPFDADSKALVPTSNKGESPGNSVFFKFKVYSDSALRKQIGTATYTCSFDFNNTATCEAFYDLSAGTLFAAGPVDFTKLSSTMAVTGGTASYLGTSGEVITTDAASASKNETRVAFTLLG